MNTIFTQKKILPPLKKALLIIILMTTVLLLINYYYETLPELNWQDFFWKQIFTFVLIFIVYFLTDNYKDLKWKDLGIKLKDKTSK